MTNKKKQQPQRRLAEQITPKTQGQTDYILSIIQNDITICTGPAGSGKSKVAVGIAAEKLFCGDYKKLIITRPIVGCGRKSLGMLPGDINEKMAPYMAPIIEHLKTSLGMALFGEFMIAKRVIIAPLEYMRGANFDDAFIILDEAQNADIDELKMFITRFGTNCKMVINGDPRQTDLDVRDRGLDLIMDRVKRVHGFGVVELTNDDIVRHDIVRRFLEVMYD